ncbi:NAD-dependent epimerase/dehydratase family protein [Pseudogracilibacillus sp. SO30301A]|uniref:NAD-dependent epimerase/dehydratase family protein n=1 Tax=Pseudogracilibacillus sp. SO30301A TaxID=3098291 RepID=UPI00300E16B0
MDKKTIGILGSYGAVGQLLTDFLKDNYHIITTYYSSKRNETDIYINIYQPSTMRSFIKQCDVVVNCAGPSYLVSAQISEFPLTDMQKHTLSADNLNT